MPGPLVHMLLLPSTAIISHRKTILLYIYSTTNTKETENQLNIKLKPYSPREMKQISNK